MFALALALLAPAAPEKLPAGVESVTAAFEPASAKPGDAVTLKITVKLLPGYYTYPLKQPDRAAAGMVNKLTLPADALTFGAPKDPAKFDSKSEPDLGIQELRTLPGEAVFEVPATVPGTLSPSPLTVAPALKLSVCDKNNCYPPVTVKPAATLTVK